MDKIHVASVEDSTENISDQREDSLVFDPSSPEFLKDPYPTYTELRHRQSVHHEPLANRWYVTHYQDVQHLLKGRNYAHDLRKASEGTASHTLFKKLGEEQLSMLFLDDPEHTRLRKLTNKAFHLPAVEALYPRIQAIADALLDQVVGQESFDVIEVLAAPISTMVIAEILGVDSSAWHQFKQWSDADAKGFDPFITEEEQKVFFAAQQALYQFFYQEALKRRQHPQDDLITRLVHARDGQDMLTDTETATMCQLLIRAGNVTTTDLIGNGILALLQHPEQLHLLRQQPELITNVVEEILRYNSSVLEAGRVATEDVEIGGTFIPRGQTIMAALGAANRDPSNVEDPDTFDITREKITHCSFGAGAHFCLGAPLARAEAKIAIGTLVKRFPNLRLDPTAPIPPRQIPSFRGILSLEVLIS